MQIYAKHGVNTRSNAGRVDGCLYAGPNTLISRSQIKNYGQLNSIILFKCKTLNDGMQKLEKIMFDPVKMQKKMQCQNANRENAHSNSLDERMDFGKKIKIVSSQLLSI